jgi:hypothetical protein
VWKTAVCRIGRLVAPDLSSLYGAEEMGFAVAGPEDGDAAPREVRDLRDLPAEEQVAKQTPAAAAGDVKPPAGGRKSDASLANDDDVVDADWTEAAPEPLSFKRRVAVQKALAAQGHTTVDALAGALADVLKRQIDKPNSLLETDWDALAKAFGLEDPE